MRLDEVDREEAAHLIFFARDNLDMIREADCFEKRRNILAIMGYPVPKDEHELDLMVSTLRKAAFPPRSGGIY